MSPWPKVLFSIHSVSLCSWRQVCSNTSPILVMFGFLPPLQPMEVLVFLLQIVIAGTWMPSGSGPIVEEETKTFCFWNLSTETRPKMIQNITTRLMFNSAFMIGKKKSCILMPSYLFAPQVYCFHNAGTFSTKKETHLYKAYNLLKRVDLDLYKYVCTDNGTN